MSDLVFTNPDARLRPVGVPVRIPMLDKSHAYLVTAETFPELFRAFAAMQKEGSGETFTLVISDALASNFFADTDLQNHVIRIRFSAIEHHPYKDILVQLAHEHGHIWRDRHPDAPLLLIPPNTPPLAKEELEADLLGVCFTHDKKAVLNWNKRGGHGKSENYPDKMLLERSVTALQWSECPSPSAPISPTVNSTKPREK